MTFSSSRSSRMSTFSSLTTMETTSLTSTTSPTIVTTSNTELGTNSPVSTVRYALACIFFKMRGPDKHKTVNICIFPYSRKKNYHLYIVFRFSVKTLRKLRFFSGLISVT